LPRIKNDFLEILKSTLDGNLSTVEIEKDERSASAVILVSGGYPEAYEKGKEITGLEKISNGLMIHAGTKKVDNKILSNGGRVLASLSFGDHFQDALKHAYANAAIIEYEGKHYRKDIGFDL
jgi:phosphoribosylamine--glycine ligase